MVKKVAAESLATTPSTQAAAAPAYPARATLEGVEGSVTLSFVVDEAGLAREIAVVAASEPGWFESAAIAALRDWRFEPGRALERYSQTFDFALGGADEAEPEPLEVRIGSRICRKFPAGSLEPVTTLGEVPR